MDCHSFSAPAYQDGYIARVQEAAYNQVSVCLFYMYSTAYGDIFGDQLGLCGLYNHGVA